MPQTKPPLVLLSELTAGQSGDFFVLLVEKVRGAKKDGKPYYTCRFRDGGRVATAMVWCDGPWFEACETEWQGGAFYKIRGAYDEHPTYGARIEILNIRTVTDEDKGQGFDPLDLVERTRYDVEAMYQELWNIAETAIADVPLRRLVMTVLSANQQQLKQVPATTKHFHPFAGGLLEHILSVTGSCLHLVDKYASAYDQLDPPLNRDLVVAGAILHDIGRCVEFGEEIAAVRRTTAGHLLGHLVLGRDLVRDTARALGDVDPDLMHLLEHIIMAHPNRPEWGSPRLPLIPECLIVHYADDLDAKLEMYVRCLMKDKETGPVTARDPVFGLQLFKGRKGS
jgi:3'-5' exoribonuclease